MIHHHPQKQWRFDHGKTLTQLAELAGLHQTTLGDIETYGHSPRMDTVARIMKVTGLKADAFLPRDVQ